MKKEVVLASGNAGKLHEFEEILGPLGYTVLPQKDVVGPLDVDETGDTFEENALLKAQAVYERRGQGGFGYDPVFLVGDKSYAEMSDEEKNAISHRGRASRLFLTLLKEKEKQYADQ